MTERHLLRESVAAAAVIPRRGPASSRLAWPVADSVHLVRRGRRCLGTGRSAGRASLLRLFTGKVHRSGGARLRMFTVDYDSAAALARVDRPWRVWRWVDHVALHHANGRASGGLSAITPRRRSGMYAWPWPWSFGSRGHGACGQPRSCATAWACRSAMAWQARAEVLVDPPTRPVLGVESGIVVPTPAPSAGRRHKEFV